MKLQPGSDIGPRTALIFNGGVSKLTGQFTTHFFAGGAPVPIHVTAASIRKHIISRNPDIEVIMHSWTPEMERELRREFAPVIAEFESNPGMRYFENASLPGCKDVIGGCLWRQVSWSYSLKRSVELMRQREYETGVLYSNVIFYRPDVLLFKDIIIADILTDRRTVYTTRWGDGHCGDFHFIMARDSAIEFAKMYDVVTTGSLSCSVSCVDGRQDSQCYKGRYLEHVGIPTEETHINAGADEDVYRTMIEKAICPTSDHYLELKELGFTQDDLNNAQQYAQQC
jgi:hypothetical protein